MNEQRKKKTTTITPQYAFSKYTATLWIWYIPQQQRDDKTQNNLCETKFEEFGMGMKMKSIFSNEEIDCIEIFHFNHT